MAGASELAHSLNGQQFGGPSVFTYYAPPQTDGAVPASGPRAGGTNVTVTGAGLGGAGSHVLCRFGEELINASRVDESTLRCFAPAAPGGAPAGDLARPLAITLNGQQFTEAAADGAFIQYEPPQISTLYPVSGPATGGETTITVRGNGLGFGRADDSETRRRCAFDGTDTGAATRIETAAGAALLCESPPALRPDAPPLGEGVPLTVSLNGQQFSASSDFLAFAPHNLTLTAPASGPFAGGTLVNVSLDGAAHNATDGALCRFGDGAEVAATQPSGGGDSVLCVAPAAAAAGATPEWHEGFEAGLPDGSFTLGTARVDGGVLQLTSVEGGGAGSWTTTMPNTAGSAISITMEVLLGTAARGAGISLVFGPPPVDQGGVGEAQGAFTEMGSFDRSMTVNQLDESLGGTGLEVSIRTQELDLFQVMYDGKFVEQRQMYGVLRAAAFVNVTIWIGADGWMEVMLGSNAFNAEMQIENWNPKASWGLAIAGRCGIPSLNWVEAGSGNGCEFIENAQWVDNLVVRSDGWLTTAPVPVALALNGQQFFGAATFTYNAMWRLSAVRAPTTAPPPAARASFSPGATSRAARRTSTLAASRTRRTPMATAKAGSACKRRTATTGTATSRA